MAAIFVGWALPTKIEAYLFYKADRYDLHGKDILRTNPKEYIADLGIRSYLGGYKSTDMGRLFENAVYLQLLLQTRRRETPRRMNRRSQRGSWAALRDKCLSTCVAKRFTPL